MNSALSIVSQLKRGLTFSKSIRTSYICGQVFSNNFNLDGQLRTNLRISKRYLFTEDVLGIDKFVDTRSRVCHLFGNNREKFFERLEEHLKDPEAVLFQEDLKNLILLCENKSTDIALLQKAISQLEKQYESEQSNYFRYGPVIMRMAHHLNIPDLALELMKKEKIEFFSQISSVVIALDLLFKNERYEDVLRLFNFVADNYQFDFKYPTDAVTLYFAACYKINTLESFDKAYRVLRQVKMSTVVVRNRALAFFLALAINQNQPNISLEILKQVDYSFYPIEIRNLRLLALTKLGLFNDAFELLAFALRKDRAGKQQKVVFQETLDQMRQKLDKVKRKSLITQFEHLVKNLSESDLVEKDLTLDKVLLRPIAGAKKFESSQTANGRKFVNQA